MRRVNFLIAFFIGTFTYSLISFIAGNNGLWSYSQLLEQKKEIAIKTNSIETINQDLVLEYTALLKDRDLIASYARKLDYVKDGEKLVKIKGLKHYQNQLYDTGTVLKRQNCSYLSERFCKISGVAIGFLSFVIMFFIDLNNGNISLKSKKKKDIIQGIPVYEVPQV